MRKFTATKYKAPASFDTSDWKQAFVIHYLSRKCALRKLSFNWVNVSSRFWKLVLGAQYRDTLSLLVSSGLIEINEKYSNGSRAFSKSYRLSQSLRGEVRCGQLHSLTIKAPPCAKLLPSFSVDKTENICSPPTLPRSLFLNSYSSV